MAKNKTDREILAEHLRRKNGTFLKPTTDDWSPSYPENLVMVFKGEALFQGKQYFNIVVRGMDDCARILDCRDREHQGMVIDWLYGSSIITMDMLENNGFTL
ncbi:hypothetical protein [Vibrio crassostreae]|uniref:hypothetical protein n=1 Tax=Vibrio crassostreae TaxID=246167 RepID=UPI001B30F395|nr:hypothetical protein [Vibrio crassostreae]